MQRSKYKGEKSSSILTRGRGALEFEKGQKLPPTARALRAHTCQIAPIWDLYPSSNSRHKSEKYLINGWEHKGKPYLLLFLITNLSFTFADPR